MSYLTNKAAMLVLTNLSPNTIKSKKIFLHPKIEDDSSDAKQPLVSDTATCNITLVL